MINQKDKKRIITYGPSDLRNFEVLAYEWIDNLCFTIDPAECLENAEEYLAVVRELFLTEGWYGDGNIELMWIPPFMFEGPRTDLFTLGVIVWHVKQREDGISWILHPKGMFENLITNE
ncbi:hypothetical protein [Puia dinghuensis]|uniref:Uncharacterized protein n=1 Tax=Puia dinghuensis TaxID=1792502 RepID=A0A8J2U6J4_9BACT|nr:hypothetical protein [Puia dinghuensis]GGA82115.1 hypothetical protein GCM10011511_01350 [Puia dinghuensis]